MDHLNDAYAGSVIATVRLPYDADGCASYTLTGVMGNLTPWRALMLDEELPATDANESDPGPEETPENTGVVVRPPATMLLFQAPETELLPARKPAKPADPDPEPEPADVEDGQEDSEAIAEDGQDGDGGNRRRRRRGGRRRGGRKDDDEFESDDEGDSEETDEDTSDEGGSGDSRRRRRRRRPGEDDGAAPDDPENTVTRTRKQRNPEDEIASVSGSTRLEAKKQRRREGREAGRRRAPIVSEAEFLARRESVDRAMVIRQRDDLTQIAVLEDKVLVEHYVARKSQTSLIGNVYLGKVQNVLPSMEAAFIDIGKGRNAVLYAGEVNWAALGHPEGEPRKIEAVLSPGQAVLVQVSKDPVGAKGARLTSQISLPGRFLVYVPGGNTSGISRKLPDTERTRLKNILKAVVPDTAGVIVRTAAEGASEEDLTRDVERLAARWADIEKKVEAGKAPELLYGEPDLTLKVVRDLFTEDFAKLVVQGDDAWDLVDGYVSHVAPDLRERLSRHEPGEDGADLFAEYRVDEQIAKGLDRKVWLPSGGSLIIDRTEAMTVVDVNTGKFTGSGGNLEETVTKNNLEAAEEIVRQLRLRDIGGIIVVDFIDMVLESNRELVLR
ncbi:MAG TPA: Rne/Rng family ribonuclease, partial [Marmoricola sp.]|nr:Rne/Rng family ribonuclease [Marmoricola sp.]